MNNKLSVLIIAGLILLFCSVVQASLSDGLIGYWRLDEGSGTVAVDSVGGNDGTLYNFSFTGNSGWTSGKFGGGLAFDGIDDYVSTSLMPPTGNEPRTIALWARSTNSSWVMCAAHYGGGKDAYGSSFRAEFNYLFEGVSADVSGGVVTYSANISDDEWHCYAWVVPEGATMVRNVKVYMDGVQLTQIRYSWNDTMVIDTQPILPLVMGIYYGDTIYHFLGALDEVRVYDRALSDSEIAALFNLGPKEKDLLIDIIRARMVSPNELGIDIKVSFPKDAPRESPRKVDFWANVNGMDVNETFDITRLIKPGQTKVISFKYGSEWIENPVPPRKINFSNPSQEVPRFEDNVAFTLYGVAYWEGGPHSEVASIPVEIPLPVIILHGYVYTHTAGGWFLDTIKFMAYNGLMDFLANDGYTTDDTWYRTMWGPTDCTYAADKETESDIYSKVDYWVNRALWLNPDQKRTYADKVDIIGHSTGGLVARYYAGGASTVNKVISIGTPHLGLTEFYEYAFDKSTKEAADRIMKVPRTNNNNLLLWFEPEYHESCLVDATTGAEVSEPYENNFNPAYNPNVKYLSIYANNHTDTPFKLVVNRKKNGWYKVVGKPIPRPGDGTVLELSASAFYPDPTPITSGVHQFLCEEDEVQKRVLDFLSGR